MGWAVETIATMNSEEVMAVYVRGEWRMEWRDEAHEWFVETSRPPNGCLAGWLRRDCE